jgi:hypothetical protein
LHGSTILTSNSTKVAMPLYKSAEEEFSPIPGPKNYV